MFDANATIEQMFEQVIDDAGREVADELFAVDFVGPPPYGWTSTAGEACEELVSRWRSAVPDVDCDPRTGWLDPVELIEEHRSGREHDDVGSVLSDEWISPGMATSPSASRARPWCPIVTKTTTDRRRS